MKRMHLRNLIGCLLLMPMLVQAQEKWTLERCIQHATQNSLTIKRAELQIGQAKVELKADKWSRLPSVSASSNFFSSFGRTVDPVTNQNLFENRNSNSWNANMNLPLFNGGAIHYNVQQSKLNLEAAQQEAKATANDLALNVANAYLQILFAKERLKIAEEQVSLNKKQLDQISRLIKAGVRPENDSLDVLAQIAVSEQSVVQQSNQVSISILNLKQLLELPASLNLEIETPAITIPQDANPDALNLEQIFGQAFSTMPQVRAGDLRLKAAEFGRKIANASAYPTIGLGGSLSTAFSDQFALPTSFVTSLSAAQNVVINGTPSTLSFFEARPKDIKTVNYFTQLDQNFGQGVGLQLSIPIFSRGQIIANKERAKLGVMTAELNNRQTMQQLKTDIQSAIANARAAKRAFEAASRTLKVQEASFKNNSKRLELGAINNFEFQTAESNLTRARIDQLVAKYDYLFRLKVIDFYLGRPITLK